MKRKTHTRRWWVLIMLCCALRLSAADSFENSMDLIFDTSPQGADINDDIKNCWIRIELNSVNFDFSSIAIQKSDELAGDLFFFNNNSFFPYRIESFDRNSGNAVILVQIPTLYGNNRSQGITMAWNKHNKPIADQESAIEYAKKVNHQKKYMYLTDDVKHQMDTSEFGYGVWTSNDSGGFTVVKK